MKKTGLLFLLIFLSLTGFSQTLSIIPQPVDSRIMGGNPFTISKQTPFYFSSGRAMANVIEFNSLLKKTYGIELKWATEITDTTKPYIFLNLTKDSTIAHPEGYQITSTENFIKITANTRQGIFYGLISILQMMQPAQNGDGVFHVPACEISDYPRFEWRGMHLDVCRHFFGKEFIKKYLDLLALHKMNMFHWHLTEDQGWRIEIKKYPLLTEIGGWRNGSMVGRYTDHIIDDVKYGGFYTQDDIREIIKYASSRHITIIPEIEMPGHALAALAAYPQYSCTGGPFEVAREWGVFEDVYCAGNENTFKFIEDILTEVCALFPGKYIHIGGDECPKERWKHCPKCQKRMLDEGLKDEHELQSYFIRRIEKFLNSKGKQIIGWDEILEGGLAPNAAVMSWRGEQGGIEAANQQHNVVMSPGSNCYFDHYQGEPALEPIAIGGYTTVEKVYGYNPIPANLHDSLTKYILGAQGNVWTEYILDEKHLEYMALPRMTALSEVLWTPINKKDEKNFIARLVNHFTLLDKWDVNYAKSMYQVHINTLPMEFGVIVEFASTPGLGNIEYQFLDLNGNPYPFDVEGRIVPSERIIFNPDNNAHQTIQLSNFHGIVEARIENTDIYTRQYIHTSKASSKILTFNNPPNKAYNTNSEFTLVNGIKAELPRKNNQWNAWNGVDVEIGIDLLGLKEIEKVEIGYLLDISNWIWLPKEVVISTSTNGKKYKIQQVIGSEIIQQNPRQLLTIFKKTKARFVKIIAKNPGKIPIGNPGSGEDSWLFFDEILID